MKVEGRRTSSNVVDNRKNTAVKAGGAVGGAGVVAIVIYLLTNGQVDLTQQMIQQPAQPAAVCQIGEDCETAAPRKDGVAYETGEFKDEDDLKNFASIILASTEDVWTDVFQKNGQVYPKPKMVLFTDRVSTGCGDADFNVGPFYCSADQALYIDLAFLANMKKLVGTGGDFAYAYVIAHEVGHHVQNVLGTLRTYNTKEAMLRKQNQEADANLISVQIELQADYYAGVWAHYESNTYGSIDQSDIKKGLDAAVAVGDDTLGVQRKEKFSHGSSEMRVKWLYKGLKTGDMNAANTFEYPSLQALEAIDVTNL